MSAVASRSTVNGVNGGLAYPPFGEGDKYRGAVVEVRLLQFCVEEAER